MSKFKLLRNFNGNFKGEEITVCDHQDGDMVRFGYGVKIEDPEPEGEDVSLNIVGPTVDLQPHKIEVEYTLEGKKIKDVLDKIEVPALNKAIVPNYKKRGPKSKTK